MPDSIQTWLRKAAEQLSNVSETPDLDSEILLCFCLNKDRTFLRAWPEKSINTEQSNLFQTLISKRFNGMPIAYLTGEREFWSRSFKVSPNVLIPRPDTELLIELGLFFLSGKQNFKVIDLGTGSGILAITLAAERPSSNFIAVDNSSCALNIAQENADQHGAKNIQFSISNWFDEIFDDDFDLVISNPPYIASHDPHLTQGDLRYEPRSALVSHENGLKDIRLIAEQSTRHLKRNGRLLIEHGYNQKNEVQTIFKALNYLKVCTYNDLSGLPRVTSGTWNPQ
jgi:release factor glutamine methyltransferase